MFDLLVLGASGVEHHEVSAGVTLCFAGILVAMVLSLAFEEKIHAKKSMITGAFAVVCLFLGASLGLLPFGPITNTFGERLPVPVYIPPIDWGVIAIILGSSLFVDATSKSGLFTKVSDWMPLRSLKGRNIGRRVKLLLDRIAIDCPVAWRAHAR